MRPALTSRARRGAWLGTAVIAGVLAALPPTVASAHAILVSSQPAPGSVLGTPPGAVVLVFDQPLDVKVSQASVTDPSGHTVSAAPFSSLEIRVDLVTALPGAYQVVWTSVSTIDGHALSGAYGFAVESAQTAAAGITNAPSGLTVAATAGRWIEDAALLLALGMLFIEWLSRRSPPLAWVRVRVAPVIGAAAVAGAVLAVTEAAAAAGAHIDGIASYLVSTTAGQLTLLRVVVELCALVVVTTGVLQWPPPRVTAAALVGVALVAVAGSGHAAAIDPRWWGIGIDAAHLAAAAVWAGGIVALATLRPPQGWRRDGRALLVRFTPWALAAFAATVALGLLEAVATLGSIGALVSTAYGRALLVKMAGIVAMVPLSLVAWRWRRPHPRVQAVIAAGVVAAAATLAAFPTPSSVARSAQLAASIPAAAAGLPSDGETTTASNAGQVLVGLSLDPGRPGMNSVIVYVLPVEGGAAASRLRVTAAVDRLTVALRDCGDTCRRGTVSLTGGEAVTVSVAGSTGGTARFTVPHLPAPAATSLVARARSVMSRAQSVALHETLTGGAGVTLVTDYREKAPDALMWTQPSGFESITIGSKRYFRQNGGAPWTVDSGAPVSHEPQYAWSYFTHTRAAHVLGTDQVDGVPVQVVGFFSGTPGTPIWFTFFIDDHGVVHRSVMAAPGHFMAQTFVDFNAPLDIHAPP